MQLIKKLVNILIVAGIFLTSCEKFYEPDLDNRYRDARIYYDPAFAEGIMLNAYNALPSTYNFEETASDDAVINLIGSNYTRMNSGEWSALFNPVSIWSAAYQQIYNLNYFLNVADSVTWSWASARRNELFKKRFTGEALALRAMFNFELLKRHGGIADGELLGFIIMKKNVDIKSNWDIPRNTYEECVNFILEDINEAISLLPYEYINDATDMDYTQVFGAQNVNRINGKIGMALKAQVLLYVASPAFNDGTYIATKYIDAAQQTGPLLVEKGGTLTGVAPDGIKFYDADNDITNPEILWRRDYVTNYTLEKQNFPPSLYGAGNVNPTQNLVDAFPMKNGYPITDAASGFNPAAPYANRDPRLAAYIIYNGNTLSTAIYTDINSPVNGLNKTTSSTRTGYYLKKMLRTDVNLYPTVMSTKRHFYTFIRYTELFLIYAEAANEAWGPDADPNSYGFTARSVIEAIRKRAGITQPDAYLASISTREAMRDLIRNERRIELCFEGFRFWDLRRWNLNLTETAKGISINGTTYTVIDVENRQYQSYMRYGPIPYSETIKSNVLMQNEGW